MKMRKAFSKCIKEIPSIGIYFFISLIIANVANAEGERTAEYYYQVGISSLRLDQRDKAIEAYKEAIKLEPDNTKYYLELTNVYMNSQPQENKLALDVIKKAIKIDTNNANAYRYLGSIFFNTGKYEESIVARKKAIELKPDDPENYIGLGTSYFLLWEFQNTVDIMEKAIDLDPNDYQMSEIHYNMGRAYLCLGNRPGAIRQYEILKTIRKDSAEFLLDQIQGKLNYKPFTKRPEN